MMHEAFMITLSLAIILRFCLLVSFVAVGLFDLMRDGDSDSFKIFIKYIVILEFTLLHSGVHYLIIYPIQSVFMYFKYKRGK